jgi:hypothetical protein
MAIHIPIDAIMGYSFIVSIAKANAFISASHTIIAKLLGDIFSFLLGYVLSQTGFPMIPDMCIHALLFCCMTGTLEWLQAAWTFMTRDELPAGLPGPEVTNVVIKGLLLVLYVINVLFWSYLVAILTAVSNHFVLLLCLGIGLSTLFLLSGMTLLWLGGIERRQEESVSALSLRLLLTILVRAVITAHKFYCGALQLGISFNAYLLEAWHPRPRPEQYR